MARRGFPPAGTSIFRKGQKLLIAAALLTVQIVTLPLPVFRVVEENRPAGLTVPSGAARLLKIGFHRGGEGVVEHRPYSTFIHAQTVRTGCRQYAVFRVKKPFFKITADLF